MPEKRTFEIARELCQIAQKRGFSNARARVKTKDGKNIIYDIKSPPVTRLELEKRKIDYDELSKFLGDFADSLDSLDVSSIKIEVYRTGERVSLLSFSSPRAYTDQEKEEARKAIAGSISSCLTPKDTKSKYDLEMKCIITRLSA
jgi:hypothetical protein